MAQSTITRKSNTKLFSKTITSGDITNTYANVLLSFATPVQGTDLSGIDDGVKASVAIKIGATGLTGASSTGLSGATIYDATITVDAVAYPVSFLGSQATTISALITQLGNDLTGAGVTIAIYDDLSNTYVRIQKTVSGSAYDVTYTDGVTNDIADSIVTQTPVHVAGTDGSTRTASMTVDGGGAISISVIGKDCSTVANLITQINADITGSGLTAALNTDGTAIVITYGTSGVHTLTFTNTSITNNVTAGGGLTVGTPTAGTDSVAFTFTGVPSNTAVYPILSVQRSGAFLSNAGYKTSYASSTTTLTVSTTGTGTVVAGDLMNVAVYF